MKIRSVFGRSRDWLSLKWAAVRYPLGSLVSWTATVIGLLSGGAALLLGTTSSATHRELIWGWALVLITGVSFSAFAISNFRRVKGKALASTIRQQAQATDTLRDTRNFLLMHALTARAGSEVPSDVLGRARAEIQRALGNYADVFSATTGTRCRLCIKLIRVREGIEVPEVDDFFLYAVARDPLSETENRTHDEKRKDEYLDPLKDNSDFVSLWSQDIADEGVFFSNNLPEEDDYNTSSLNYRYNVASNPNQSRRDYWPLWYLSTIVWPIRQEERPPLGLNEYVHHGFLTVDSRIRGAFDRDVHEPMGRMLANALFPVIDLYTEILASGVDPTEES